MLTLIVLTLAASPQPKTRLALPGLAPVKIDAETANFYSEHLAQQLKAPGVEVVTTREISAGARLRVLCVPRWCSMQL